VPLPHLPKPALQAESVAPSDRSGFLWLDRLKVRIAGGEPFSYDVVSRRAIDAVVIAPHFERDGKRHVMLVSAIRVPLHVRGEPQSVLWELPAGLVEPGEAFAAAAARELFEEVGAKVSESAMLPLGPTMYPVPALIAEVHAFFHVPIDPDALVAPPGDTSALEREQQLFAIGLDEALALCASGDIRDSKTELGLRRLKDVFP
jgi:8-oxo-dGTP pyrophosphatase MutT (NUDIX family)